MSSLSVCVRARARVYSVCFEHRSETERVGRNDYEAGARSGGGECVQLHLPRYC
eukprot:COSAG06_NODE_6317_length_2987_cov_2.306440_2_plen_54_part_00